MTKIDSSNTADKQKLKEFFNLTIQRKLFANYPKMEILFK